MSVEARDEDTITWTQIVKLEPRLAALYRQAKAVKDDKSKRSFCANTVWYGSYGRAGFKDRMVRLVGFETANPRLQTMRAYDIAYGKLYSALPDCRNCMCM
jgi:hypothetical protein